MYRRGVGGCAVLPGRTACWHSNVSTGLGCWHAAQRADRLSGGQQQRVAIARALAQQAELIIADEPVASLDPNTSAEILDLLRNIARSDGIGVVCSLHQVPYAKAYADRIVGLSHGRVMLDVPTERFDRAAFERLYVSPAISSAPASAA